MTRTAQGDHSAVASLGEKGEYALHLLLEHTVRDVVPAKPFAAVYDGNLLPCADKVVAFVEVLEHKIDVKLVRVSLWGQAVPNRARIRWRLIMARSVDG